MIQKMYRRACVALVFLVFAASVAPAADDTRTERVQFKRGASSAVVEGSLTGYQSVDYVLGAKAGQSMTVNLTTDNGSNYFNILAPGETTVAMFIGSTEGNQFAGTLPATGDYTVRVYLMRNAARRNEVANYRLEMIIAAGGAQAAASTGSDAKVPGTNYHATGEIPCSMGGGQPAGSCPFGVERKGGGTAIVTVTKPDGRTRAIFFESGEATGSDASQADGGEFRAEKQSDQTIVHIGDERYEIWDAVIFGG